MENNYEHIPAEKFEFARSDERISDKKLETKPIGYFKDAWIRFRRNKSSVFAACIILCLVLYALIVPLTCSNNYTDSTNDTTYLHYAKLRPKLDILAWAGWDGGYEMPSVNESTYNYYRAIGIETGCDPVMKIYSEGYQDSTSTSNSLYFDIRINSYYRNGMLYLTLTPEQYANMQQWQNENNIQVIYPAVNTAKIANASKKTDANIWYEVNQKGVPILDGEGNFKDIYKVSGDDGDYSSLRIPGDDGSYKYANVTGTSSAKSYVVRVFTYNYFIYRYGFEPSFVFGTNNLGQDIFYRLSIGARFSFVFAVCIAFINLFIGAVYGAIEGYYGGRIDLIMERFAEILSGVPFIVVTTLFQLHLASKVGVIPALLFAFVLTGWIGMASSVRMQFYRFKGQEYILSARTLGASDWRLMFKHIFPNSLGTLITGSVLVIPGVMFTESSLTYLGIINLETSTITSVGTMLAQGNALLSTDPYIIFFPALFISLLEISFNLFGNGLRDAFNPSLRGVED